MKLLYIGRIFSGLESSLLSGEWAPTGVPTIFKIIEALDRTSHELRIILIDKGVSSNFRKNWKEHQPTEIKLKGLKTKILVVPADGIRSVSIGRIRSKLIEISQLRTIHNVMKSFSPSLVYVDRSNVLAGAMSARWFAKPTLLRIMGIYPSMRAVLTAKPLMARLERWAFRSPFSAVLCTQDGTGGEAWMDKALESKTPKFMMLNGIQSASKYDGPLHPALSALPKDKTIVMFVGRLEDIKGWREFVKGMLLIQQEKHSRQFHALIIGTGSGKNELEEIISRADAVDDFTLIDRLPHAQMSAARDKADIYVSLNKLGNLSNANLECFADGKCVIMPKSDNSLGIDVATDQIIPKDAAIRINKHNLEKQLAKSVGRLIDNPETIATFATNMKAAADRELKSWESRIESEIELIESLVTGDNDE